MVDWSVTESNSHITDPITLHDFVSLGVVEEQLPDGSLRCLDDPRWRSTNRLPFIWGLTADKKHSIIAHGGLPMSCPVGRPGKCLISVDSGMWKQLNFRAPLYYDEAGTFLGYPTVYTDPKGDYIGAIAYAENARTWFYKVVRRKDNVTILDVVAKAVNVPFWMGKPEGPYLVHGLYSNVKDVDCWGGWADYTNMQAILTDPRTGKQGEFMGKMLMDREYHRAYIKAPGVGPYSFAALSMHTREIDAAFLHSVNPITGMREIPEIGIKTEKQARLNHIPSGQSFAWDDYFYSDNGELKPDNIRISGESPHGPVDLRATVIKSYGFVPKKGSWWNRNLLRTWGRHFLRWNGNIGDFQIVNAIGFSEFTRTRVVEPTLGIVAPVAVGTLTSYFALQG